MKPLDSFCLAAFTQHCFKKFICITVYGSPLYSSERGSCSMICSVQTYPVYCWRAGWAVFTCLSLMSQMVLLSAPLFPPSSLRRKLPGCGACLFLPLGDDVFPALQVALQLACGDLPASFHLTQTWRETSASSWGLMWSAGRAGPSSALSCFVRESAAAPAKFSVRT